MKILLAMFISIFSVSYALADEELKFDPTFTIGAGMQTGPMKGSETVPYVVAKTILIRDTFLDKANLLGVGLSLNTNGDAQAILAPMSFYVEHLYVSPEIGFGIGSSPMKLGLSMSYGF